MNKNIKYIYHFFKSFLYKYKIFYRSIDKPTPIFIKNHNNSGLKVHLGAGPINLQGWINVDARDYPHTHLVAKNFNLTEFSDGSICEIYMCHVLEHFSFIEASLLLRNLKTKLRDGGVIRLSVPSFDSLINTYLGNNKNIDFVKMALMGGQDYEFNFHKSIYNYQSLKTMLEESGYANVTSWDTVTDFGVDLGDWSNKTFPSSNGLIDVSLNLKGVNKIL
jgi:predicted SAM-dependent methyltransferase